MQNFSRLKLRQTKNKSVGPPLPFSLKAAFVDFISIKKPEKNCCFCLLWLLRVLLALSNASSTCYRSETRFRKNNSTVLSSWPAIRVRGVNPSPRVRYTTHGATTRPQAGQLRKKYSVLLSLAREPAERPCKQGLSLPFTLACTC